LERLDLPSVRSLTLCHLDGSERGKLAPQTSSPSQDGGLSRWRRRTIETAISPTVGGISGVAVGAELGLAMAPDVRLIARSAKLMAGYRGSAVLQTRRSHHHSAAGHGYERAMRFMMEDSTVQGEVAPGMVR
jgi:2-(1,2-epoxy-1,2-dihydrophenyl)acetyl-CoA isomerase